MEIPMRYGLIADNMTEQQFIESPRSTRGGFDTLLPVIQARAITSGVRLGIFESLRIGGRTASEIAEILNLDGGTVGLILRVLACAGYVKEDGGRYALSMLSRETLLEGAMWSNRDVVCFNDLLWECIGRMDEVARRGQGYDIHDHLGDSTSWKIYQAAMLENARRNAPFIVPLIPVKPGARKLLDIAGSHGLYGALISREHPPMRSEVLDLPQAVESSRQLAEAEGINDVVTYRSGNALTDDLGDDYDVVFLGNILHHFIPEQIMDLLRRIRSAMILGGTVAILDIRQPEPNEPPEIVGDGLSLFFQLTSKSRCYAPSEVTAWLTDTGFMDVRAQTVPFAPFNLLATGRR
jgi:hypothetical protein